MKTAVAPFFQYLRIEWKRACVGIGHMAVSIIVMTAVLAGAAAGTAMLMAHAGTNLAPVRVCIAGVAPDSRVRDIVKLLGGMESIRNICTFEVVDSSEAAMDELESGKSNAAVVLPENFYQDIMTGVNTPAVVYAPAKGMMATDLFQEMMGDGVSLIRASESAIYAATDQISATPIVLGDVHDMDVLLTDLYIRTCMNRLGIYIEETHSALGDLTLPEYYSAAAIALLIFGLSLNFSFLFTRENLEMERKLRVYGVNTAADAAVKTLVIAGTLWIMLAAVVALGTLILSARGLINIPVSFPVVLLRLIPLVLMAGAFDYAVYALTRDTGHAGMIYLLMGLFMIFAGGCILPSVFLPAFIRHIGEVVPVYLWRAYAAQALFSDHLSLGVILEMLLPAAVLYVIGLAGSSIRESYDRGNRSIV